MKERPILFSAAMVRAIIDKQKTQTRRIVKRQSINSYVLSANEKSPTKFAWSNGWVERCPYGQIGDRLWVREAWRVGAWNENSFGFDAICVDYKADNHSRKEWLKVNDSDQFEKLWIQSTNEAIKAGHENDENGNFLWEPGQSPCRWRPSIFMPRWASRINLEIKNVRVEKLQDITEEDAKAESVSSVKQFAELWDLINKKRSYGWNTNPYVWVIDFERIE